MTVLFDKMLYVDRLKLGGIEEASARAHAEALETALHETVATKADLREQGAGLREEIAALRTELREEIAAIRGEIAAVRTELREEIVAVRMELREEIGAVRTDLREEIAAVRTELREEIVALESRLRAEVDSLRHEMTAMEGRLRAEITEIRNDHETFRVEVNHRFQAVEQAIRESEQRVTIRLGGMLVVAVGAIALLVQLA